MKHNIALTITSLLSILLMTFHLVLVRGIAFIGLRSV
jgi:hypothetical protein